MKIWMVIANCGDGSNRIDMIKDQEVLYRVQELADDGDETYASGDGLQVHGLWFPEDFDVDTWVKKNFFGWTTFEDLE